MSRAPTAMAVRCLLAGAAFATVAFASPRSARAYCPSYTPADTATGAKCAVQPALGRNPDTGAWRAIFARVAGGMASWGGDGPPIGTLRAGCSKPSAPRQVDAFFPCHVLQALAMQESGWRQFCVPDTPASAKGAAERTIVTFDCGYGVGQVTSGMHVGETVDFDRRRVAAEPIYNLSTGTRILRDKWAATACVGDRNPDVVEDWYSALWAYNGLSYANNPNNPNLTAGRAPYNPKNGGSYAYQERVLGWMEFPPSTGHWPPLAPAYPNRGQIGDAARPAALDEPSCAGPTVCTTTRPTHRSSCGDALSDRDAGATADAAAEAGVRAFAEAGVSGFVGVVAGDSGAVIAAEATGTAAADGGCDCRASRAAHDDASDARLALGGAALAAAWITTRRRRRS